MHTPLTMVNIYNKIFVMLVGKAADGRLVSNMRKAADGRLVSNMRKAADGRLVSNTDLPLAPLGG